MRLDAVGESVFLANVQPEARTHGGTTQYVVEHHDRHSHRTAELRGDVAYDAVAQVVVALVAAAFRLVALEGLALFINKVCRLAAEISHGQFLELLEADVADGGQNHLVGAVVVRHEIEDVLPMEAFHQLGGAQYVARQRMPLEDHLLE